MQRLHLQCNVVTRSDQLWPKFNFKFGPGLYFRTRRRMWIEFVGSCIAKYVICIAQAN